MFTQAQLDDGTEETYRQFFSVDLEGFAEAQFNKLTSNYFIDCVCRHCGEYIKYISLRALLIHAIGCSKQKLQMQQDQLISLEEVETIEIPFMQCGTLITQQEKQVLSSLAEIKSLIFDKDEENNEEEFLQNSLDQIVEQQNISKQTKKQSMSIEQSNQDDLLKKIIKATEYHADNAKRFLLYINEGKSSRSQIFDRAIETKQNLKPLLQKYWLMKGVPDPRKKYQNIQQQGLQYNNQTYCVMHRPDLLERIGFLQSINLKLSQFELISYHFFIIFFNFLRTWNKQRKNLDKKNESIQKQVIQFFHQPQKIYLLITIFTQILILFYTGADICDLPCLTEEMFNKNLYQYVASRTKKQRNFKLHSEDHSKLLELIRRLKAKKIIVNFASLALGDSPDTIQKNFYDEMNKGSKPLLTLEDIKACRACEIFNFQGKESITSDQIKDFFGHNKLSTTIKYLADYSKVYRTNSQPFCCPTIGQFVKQSQKI